MTKLAIMDGGRDILENQSIFEDVSSSGYNWIGSYPSFGGFKHAHHQRNQRTSGMQLSSLS